MNSTLVSRPRTAGSAGDGGRHAPAAVVGHLRQIFVGVRGRYRSVQERTGLQHRHLSALGVIAAGDAPGVGQLADSLGLHQSTASNLLRPLLERGLVVARRSQTDRRAVHLVLTPAGRQVVRKAPDPFDGLLARALTELEPRTVRRLERDLGRLADALAAPPDGA